VRSGVQSTKAAASPANEIFPPLYLLSVGTYTSSSRGSTPPESTDLYPISLRSLGVASRNGS
jgi:hypothetical protein